MLFSADFACSMLQKDMNKNQPINYRDVTTWSLSGAQEECHPKLLNKIKQVKYFSA
jgi:hypothetical protein